MGFGLIVSAVFEGEQLRANVGRDIAQLPQAQQLRGYRQAHAGGFGFGQSLAGMFAQCMCHFVAHDHADFSVGQLSLVQDTRIKNNFAAWHAPRVELFAANQIDFPFPLA